MRRAREEPPREPFLRAEAREWHVLPGRQLTGHGLDLNHDVRGKTSGPSAARLIHESLKALVEEPSSPLADDLPGKVQPLGDDFVLQAIRREEDELGTDHLEVRRRIPAGCRLELGPLEIREEDCGGTGTWHLHLLSEDEDIYSGR
jgi:hypothetical protein